MTFHKYVSACYSTVTSNVTCGYREVLDHSKVFLMFLLRTYNPKDGRKKNPATQEQAMEELVAVVSVAQCRCHPMAPVTDLFVSNT